MNYEKFVKEVKRGVEDIVEKELGEGSSCSTKCFKEQQC